MTRAAGIKPQYDASAIGSGDEHQDCASVHRVSHNGVGAGGDDSLSLFDLNGAGGKRCSP